MCVCAQKEKELFIYIMKCLARKSMQRKRKQKINDDCKLFRTSNFFNKNSKNFKDKREKKGVLRFLSKVISLVKCCYVSLLVCLCVGRKLDCYFML